MSPAPPSEDSGLSSVRQRMAAILRSRELLAFSTNRLDTNNAAASASASAMPRLIDTSDDEEDETLSEGDSDDMPELIPVSP